MAQNESSIKTSSMKKTSETYSTLRKGTEHNFISQQWALFVEINYLYRDEELCENYSFKDKVIFIVGGTDILSSKAIV